MGPIAAISSGFRRIYDFSGEAGRAEFFWLFPFGFLGQQLCLAIDTMSGSVPARFVTPAFMIVWLTLMFSATARRLNHMGYQGRWLRYSVLFGIVATIAYIMHLFLGPATMAEPNQMDSRVLIPFGAAAVLIFPAWFAVMATVFLSLFNAERARA